MHVVTEHEKYAPLRAALGQDLRIEQVLGESAEGAAYLARDLTLDRRVLVKALDRARADEAAVEAFAREARVLASLSDPCVPAIHHAGSAGDFRYIVREPPEGPTLEERRRTGPLPQGDVVRIGLQILGALHAA
ncbi:MAG: serine/threonine protein kinase, partial [Gemmatimonadales bacterium]